MKSAENKEKIILLIHQSSSLYGSDKTLLDLVLAIQEDAQWTPIVVLPSDGLLNQILENRGVEVYKLPVLKVSRSLLSLKNLWKLPFRAFKEIQTFKSYFKDRNIAIIHSNTLAVLIGALVYKALKAKHIWHVHEMIEKPTLIKKIYRYILPRRADLVITNSMATNEFWLQNRDNFRGHFKMVYNGLEVPPEVSAQEIASIKKNLFQVPLDSLVIGLVGRINQYKGHRILLKAFEQIYRQYPNVYLIMVGSAPPGKEIWKNDLENYMNTLSSHKYCRVIDFQADIYKIWASIDIAVVPTIIAESFGLVALEAMLAKKPVVASSIGGLKEVVDDHVTGYLFEPENIEELKEQLSLLIENDYLRVQFGNSGYHKAIRQFSKQKYTNSIIALYNQIIA